MTPCPRICGCIAWLPHDGPIGFNAVDAADLDLLPFHDSADVRVGYRGLNLHLLDSAAFNACFDGELNTHPNVAIPRVVGETPPQPPSREQFRSGQIRMEVGLARLLPAVAPMQWPGVAAPPHPWRFDSRC
jgi:hypothetical protein